MPLRLVATCGLGLENILAAEISTLGGAAVTPERGAVRFEGSWEDCWRANWRLRTANRVLVELASWAAPDDESLSRGIHSFLLGRKVRRGSLGLDNLAEIFHPDRSIAVQASCSASTVTDTRWAALKIKDGICDAQRELHGSRSVVDRDSPSLPLRLRLHRERATLLLDSSGESLDRRGYRKARGEAPARENLAAACVLAVRNWDGRGPIADPLCGTGTLLAEAGAISLGRAPNHLRRRWAFQAFPSFDLEAWRSIRREALPTPDPQVQLYGNDLASGAIRATRINLGAAKLDEHVTLRTGALRDWTPPGRRGLLLLNPPHGKRIEGSDRLWQDIFELMVGRCVQWPTVLLGGGEGRWRGMGIRPTDVLEIRNGPLDGEIVIFGPRRKT